MKIAIVVHGRFHAFDLARALTSSEATTSPFSRTILAGQSGVSESPLTEYVPFCCTASSRVLQAGCGTKPDGRLTRGLTRFLAAGLVANSGANRGM